MPPKNSETFVARVTFIGCRKALFINIPHEGYAAWKSGELIQNALPGLTDEARELLITNICGKCFDALFAEEV
jgi:hypothetical protein